MFSLPVSSSESMQLLTFDFESPLSQLILCVSVTGLNLVALRRSLAYAVRNSLCVQNRMLRLRLLCVKHIPDISSCFRVLLQS